MGDVVELSEFNCDMVLQMKISRPQKYNALNEEAYQTIEDCLEDVQKSDDARVLVITGASPAFSSGADVDENFEFDSVKDARQRVVRHQAQTVRRIAGLSIPVLAMVNGPAVGAGMSLAMACDFIVADKDSYFQAIFPRIGLAADLGLIYHLVHSLGLYQARELLFTARRVDASEASELGFINRLAEPDRLEQETEIFVEELLKSAPLPLDRMKHLVRRALHSTYDEFLEDEALNQGVLFTTDDLREGKQAFKEKRHPEFRGS